jgi:DNA-directed RNA polymerase beta' subunit
MFDSSSKEDNIFDIEKKSFKQIKQENESIKKDKINKKEINSFFDKESDKVIYQDNLSKTELKKLRSLIDEKNEKLPSLELVSLTFLPYTTESLKSHAVFKCENNISTKIGGLSDPRLGVVESSSICSTCSETNTKCSGHMAYIELPKKFIISIFRPKCVMVLKSVCFTCSRLLIPENELIREFGKGPSKTKLGRISEKSEGLRCLHNLKTPCPQNPIFSNEINSQNIAIYKNLTDKKNNMPNYISAEKVHSVFSKISEKDSLLLGFTDKIHPKDYITETLPVPSPFCRRYNLTPDGNLKEDYITTYLKSIQELCGQYYSNNDPESQNSILEQINDNMNHIVSSSAAVNGGAISSLGNKFKGKYGIFRNTLLAKRANFTCRTVIDPAPGLMEFGELGIPLHCSTILTVPEKITIYNFERIKKLESEGKIQRYIPISGEFFNNIIQYDKEKTILKIGDTVERNCEDGDYVVFNRQPTIHKFSMLGFKIVLIPDSFAIRMPLPNTSGFNADFDGDEMNFSLTQTTEGICENKYLLNTRKNISCSFGYNTPSVGHNSLLAWYILTNPDSLYNGENREIILDDEDYSNMFKNIKGKLNGVEDIDERIIKAAKFYCNKMEGNEKNYKDYLINKKSGRGIFSHLLRNDFHYENNPDDEKNKLIICFGVLLKGRIKKSIIGQSSTSIVKVLDSAYGSEYASDFITNATLVGYWFIEIYGFTISIKDLMYENDNITNEISKKKKSIIAKMNFDLYELSLLDEKMKTQNEKEDHEEEKVKVVQKYSKKMLEEFSKYIPKDNNILKMMYSGTKGKEKDTNRIFWSLGQAYSDVTGRSSMKSSNGKRWLFTKNVRDKSAESRAFCDNSLFEGMDPDSYIAEAISARESSCKTYAGGLSAVGKSNRLLLNIQANSIQNNDGSIKNDKKQILCYCYPFDPEKLIVSKGKFVPFDSKILIEKINNL